MFYLDVLSEFYKNQVEYLIVGGLAVNLHGVPRVTQDIDFILNFNKENILIAVDILEKLGYSPTINVNPRELAVPEKVAEWINEKNMIAFSFFNNNDNSKVVDIVIVHDLIFQDAMNRATKLTISSIKITIASIDDIISLKQNTERQQDKSDIDMLFKLKRLTNEDGRKGI